MLCKALNATNRNTKCRKGLLVGVSLLLVVMSVLPVRATDYTNTNFIVRDPVITIEGGRSTTANFEYFSSSGQTDTGENSNTNFIHRAGFLYFPAPTPAPSPTPSPSPSGGGAATGKAVPPTGVLFTGKADAGSQVVLLKDAQITASATADFAGDFSIGITGLAAASYIFGLYAENASGERSSLFVVPVNVIAQTITKITGIFFKPGIRVGPCPPRGDVNSDCKASLVDFSILLYWFDRVNPPAHIDLDGNGKVDLVDFSILAYYWTG